MRYALVWSVAVTLFACSPATSTRSKSDDKPDAESTDTTDDTGTDDTGTDDTGTEDTGTDDTGTEDTGTEDTGADTTTGDTDPPDECADAEDGTPCDDVNKCTEGTVCTDGVCGGGTQLQCPVPEAECVDALQCDPDSGQCTVEIYLPADTLCDSDKDICTEDVCDGAGACAPTGAVEDCSSQQQNNPCWTWQCNKKAGCQQIAFLEGGSCDDGNSCSVSDTCTVNEQNQELCLGTPKDVDDQNPCTDDKCIDGDVIHEPLSGTGCAIGGPCQVGLCSDGTCQSSPATDGTDCGGGNVCKDGQCTALGCNPACGECQVCNTASNSCNPAPNGQGCSDDGNPCTIDQCSGGGCAHPDAANGTSCPGGKCQGGSCVEPAKAEQLAGSLKSPKAIAVDGQFVYFVEDDNEDGTVGKVPKTGGSVTTLATKLPEPTAIEVDNTHAYWLERNNGKNGSIKRVAKGGGSVLVVATGFKNAQNHLALDDTHVYFGDGKEGGGGQIKKAPKGGGATVTLIDEGILNLATAVDVDESWVYFHNDKGSIMRIGKNGGAPQTLGGGDASAMFLLGDTLYFGEYSKENIKSVPKIGGAVTKLTGSADSVAEVVADANHVYWAEHNSNGQIARVPVGGGAVEQIYNQANTRGVALDATHVYWSVSKFSNSGKIFRKLK